MAKGLVKTSGAAQRGENPRSEDFPLSHGKQLL